MSLEGKIAAVTGAAMGIGRASAQRLAEDGADVAILDIDPDGLAETAAVVEAEGRKCFAVTCDLLDREQVKASFAKIAADFGTVNILHNNAGQSGREKAKSGFEDSDPEQWDFILAINLRASADCAREVMRGMKTSGYGRIINTSSSTAYRGGVGLTDYATSKAAILGLTRSLALELAPHKVTVNAVCPGTVETRALKDIPKETLEPVIAEIPMKTTCQPEDIAHVVSFYASPGAWYVTGTHLMVNGGRVLL